MLQTRVARTRRIALVGLVGALTVAMSACASEREEDGSAGEGKTGGTLVFGAAGNPKNFDPIFAEDGETFRVDLQMYETLLRDKMGTAELEPGLAEKWESSNDGKSWTFTLRQGIKFHDGTPLNAEAVCFNFDRWFNLKGAAAQTEAFYYNDVFEGYANNEGEAAGDPVYKSCEVKDEATLTVNLNTAKGAFPDAFALTAFSISSPEALQKYNADEVTQTGESFSYPAYAREHPTGTGPFKFESFDRGAGTVTLVRNEDYWGEKAKLDRIIFRTIPDENARKQELKSGTIDGYDLPSPADYNSLKEAGANVMIRPPFNILYLGINQTNNPKLRDVRVRKAIEYAINKEQLVQNRLPEGASARNQFLPGPDVDGFTDAVEKHEYDPQKAKSLLAEAGAENLKLKFYVPTEVTRPYMPDPQELARALAVDLKAAGITVELVARPWNGGYLEDVQQGKQDIHLLGWTGDYADAGNFLGTFFGRPKREFGFDNPKIFNALSEADALVTDEEAQKKAYEDASVLISQYVPAVPLSSSPPAIVVNENIKGLIPSPLTRERFVTVSKE
jgi:peptide/nickel transport system substrate-binding protein